MAKRKSVIRRASNKTLPIKDLLMRAIARGTAAHQRAKEETERALAAAEQAAVAYAEQWTRKELPTIIEDAMKNGETKVQLLDRNVAQLCADAGFTVRTYDETSGEMRTVYLLVLPTEEEPPSIPITVTNTASN
jgi:metal-dependent amidase/aminoacylase/carboxypeptidase family protein